MAEYMAVGASGFGIGSALYKAGKPLDRLQSDAENFVSTFRRIADQTDGNEAISEET
jgi:2-dehydro-3-deoxyphosphogalactonate aldolase